MNDDNLPITPIQRTWELIEEQTAIYPHNRENLNKASSPDEIENTLELYAARHRQLYAIDATIQRYNKEISNFKNEKEKIKYTKENIRQWLIKKIPIVDSGTFIYGPWRIIARKQSDKSIELEINVLGEDRYENNI